MFVTAEANAQVRFRRAIERRALRMAEDAARELPNLPLEDALQLVHLYAERARRNTSERRCAGSGVISRERLAGNLAVMCGGAPRSSSDVKV
jgi:hypothetical protein